MLGSGQPPAVYSNCIGVKVDVPTSAATLASLDAETDRTCGVVRLYNADAAANVSYGTVNTAAKMALLPAATERFVFIDKPGNLYVKSDVANSDLYVEMYY